MTETVPVANPKVTDTVFFFCLFLKKNAQIRQIIAMYEIKQYNPSVAG